MAARRHQQPLQSGSQAPGFRLELLGGGTATLAEMLAKGPVMLAFFKISCPVCQLTFPFLERLQAAGAIKIYGISQNDAADTHEFNQEFGVTFSILLDTEESGFPVSNEYGISSVPTMFLVEQDGTIAHLIEGWRKKEMEALAARVGASLFQPDDYVPEWKAG